MSLKKPKVLLGGVNLLDIGGQYALTTGERSALYKTPFDIDYQPVPIGLLYIAATQRAFGSTQCEYQLYEFDVPVGEEFSLERVFSDFKSLIYDFRPDIVALGCLTPRQIPYLENAIKIAREYFKEMNLDGYLIVGGKPATSEPERFLNIGADVVCIGEGEITFTEFIDCISNGAELSKVNGIMFIESDGKFHRTPVRSLVIDIDRLPMPAWDLADLQALKIKNRNIFSPLLTSRGCPYSCIYCHHDRKYRAHSPVRVTDEIEHLVKNYGFAGMDIADEIFNCQKKRVLAIRDELKQRNLNVTFYDYDGIRGDIADEEVIDAMYEMGMRGLSIAIETASPRLQKFINKRLNIDRTLKTITMCAERDIFTNVFFMIGFPTESREEIERTISVARDCDAHRSTISKVELYKGTPLYNLAIEHGLDPRTYRLEDAERFGVRKDMGILELPEDELHIMWDNAVFDVFNNVPRMERICKIVSPIFFTTMYEKFYREQGLWTDSFSSFFKNVMRSNPIDFKGLSQHASTEKTRG